jgi:hypothetical protein
MDNFSSFQRSRNQAWKMICYFTWILLYSDSSVHSYTSVHKNVNFIDEHFAMYIQTVIEVLSGMRQAKKPAGVNLALASFGSSAS